MNLDAKNTKRKFTEEELGVIEDVEYSFRRNAAYKIVKDTVAKLSSAAIDRPTTDTTHIIRETKAQLRTLLPESVWEFFDVQIEQHAHDPSRIVVYPVERGVPVFIHGLNTI